jgi:hypothetical protein
MAEQGYPDPPVSADETTTLLNFLERQRATFAWKCGGLDASSLAAMTTASGMTLGGMLKHLARFEDDMATEWLNGLPQLPPWNAVDWEAEPDWDWRSASEDTPEELYARWQTAVERARERFEAALGQGSEQRPAGLPSIRYVLINMIEEYARHNGHADLIREAIDGLVGHDPPR